MLFKRRSRIVWILLIVTCVLVAVNIHIWPGKGLAVKTDRQSYSSDHQACVQPRLPLWSKVFINKSTCAPVVCSDDENWVYTAAGKFYISDKAQKIHGKITCAYQPIVFKNDTSGYLEKVFPVLNGSTLQSDAFKVLCKAVDGRQYVNVHACVSPVKLNFKSRFKTRDLYNVLILGFDSMSRQSVQRYLPETHDFFTRTLGGVLLEGNNIVGDGTTQALMPMLTGKAETEVPEVRRGHPGVRRIDEAVEFIWKKYERNGYVTHWAEDMAGIGTFQYRMLGFKDQPVHHYLRPYFLEAERAAPFFKKYCMGSKPIHKVFLDWLKETIEASSGTPFFTFGFFSGYSHNSVDGCVNQADRDVKHFLNYLSKSSLIDKTFVILMSDHGLRVGETRKFEQGKLEERMPYFGMYMPNNYKQQYPEKMTYLLSNSNRLTTPFDIYKTLLEILDTRDSMATRSQGQLSRAFSLFTPIPAYRTCADAGIEPHWCACLNWTTTPASDNRAKRVAEFAVMRFNTFIKDHITFCHKLFLKRIINAIKLETNLDVLKFKESKDNDGRVPDLTDQMKSNKIYYQVTIETNPGNGIFEVTSSVDAKTGNISLNLNDISRINKYNDAPKCIQEKYPSMRPFCVCK